METKPTLSRMVTERRHSLNMSQSVLALACGVSERTIMRVEAGERVSSETLMAICSVLGLSPESARAGMVDSVTSNEFLPSFGPSADASRAMGLRTLRSRFPDATVYAAGDVAAGLASPEGLGWLRWGFGVRRAPVDESDMHELCQAAQPLPLRWACKALDWARERFGMPGYVAMAIPIFVLAMSLAVVLILGFAWACLAITNSSLSFFILGIGGGSWFFHRYMTAQVRVRDLMCVVVSVSPNVVAFAFGNETREYSVGVCDKVDVIYSEDGRHLQLTVHCGSYTTARWLLAHPRLIQALEAFKNGVERSRTERTHRHTSMIDACA